MATNQLNRMVSRQDQVLQLPFPPAPSLARQIDSGVLKKEGAVRYDEAIQRDREAIQNILRQFQRWPKLEDWQAQLQSVATLLADMASVQANATQMAADLATANATIAAQAAAISALQASIANLTATINLP